MNPDEQTAAALREALIRNFYRPANVDSFCHGEQYASTDGDLVNREVNPHLGAVITTLPAGKRPCPYHLHHAQTEMFIVLEGQGKLRVAGQWLPIGPGDVITIPPGDTYPHQIINDSANELKYISLSTQEWPEVCDYPDSQKTLARAAPSRSGGAALVNRRAANLDYWDGEEAP